MTDNLTQRERVIQRAAEMFAEFGVKSIRMDDIAKDMAMSKRTLYELFADKSELLYHSVKYMHATEQRRLVKKIDLDEGGIPALLEMFFAMIEHSRRFRRFNESLGKFYPEVFKRVVTENRDQGLSRLREVLNRFISKGLISPTVNVDLSITMFYYTAMGLVRRQGQLSLPAGVSEEMAFGYTVVNFFRGIATVEGVQQIDRWIATQPPLGGYENER